MLQWKIVCIYLFKLMFVFSLRKYPEMKLPDLMAVIFLIFWRDSEAPYTFFHSGCTNSQFHQQCIKISFLLNAWQYLLFVVFLIIAILTDVKQYLIMVLVYIFLMIDEIEHLLMCLLVICMSL